MKNITELTDEDALKVFDIMGSGNPISDESKIFQTKDLLTTNKFYNQQTNLPGNTWLKIFKYLKSAGYSIGDESPESPSPSLQEAAKQRAHDLYFREDHRSYVSTHGQEKQRCIDDVVFGANWQAQQTGPILTRELHDKIWEAATKRNEHKHTQYSDAFNFTLSEKTIPDKETFWKSLNL